MTTTMGNVIRRRLMIKVSIFQTVFLGEFFEEAWPLIGAMLVIRTGRITR